MSPEQKGGIVRHGNRNVPEPVSVREVTELQRTAFTEIVGERRYAAKILAIAANKNDRTAQGWMDGLSAMSLTAFVNLVRRMPEFKPWAIRLLELDAALDPDFPKEMDALLKAYARSRGWTR